MTQSKNSALIDYALLAVLEACGATGTARIKKKCSLWPPFFLGQSQHRTTQSNPMRLVLIFLLLARLFVVTDPQRTIIPIVPLETIREKVVTKWDQWKQKLGEIGNSLQEVGTTVEYNLLHAGAELKAKEAEYQAAVSWKIKEQEKEQQPKPGRIVNALRAMNAFTMHTLRFYFALVLLLLSLIGLYFWSYLFVTYVFDSGTGIVLLISPPLVFVTFLSHFLTYTLFSLLSISCSL